MAKRKRQESDKEAASIKSLEKPLKVKKTSKNKSIGDNKDNINVDALMPFAEKDLTTDDGFLTNLKFEQVKNLSQPILQALTEGGFEKMSEIQARTIPYLLAGRDVLAQAKTGSGKTLAFLVPCIELLHQAEYKARNGTGAIIITPTRELAIQIFKEAKQVLSYCSQTAALLIGGGNRSMEEAKLSHGANLIVATPGRLLDHMLNTNFLYLNLKMLVLDEADRILENGFEEELRAIVMKLPKKRQTLLFSATQTENVADIARVALRKPVQVGIKNADKIAEATVKNLEQGYIITKQDKKLLILISILRKFRKKKVIVFFSTCACVKYFGELLNFIQVPVMQLHGKMNQGKRTATFFSFVNTKSGVLLTTNVAARGLDIPKVDWIVQYDVPTNTREYIHRVGRTARAGSKGNAILLLVDQERRFLHHLKKAKVNLKQLSLGNKIKDLQHALEEIIEENFHLNELALHAFKAYCYGYTMYPDKSIFNMKNLDVEGLAKQLALPNVPHIQMDMRKKR